MLACDWVRINLTKPNPISELWLHWSQSALRWLSSTAGHWECCWLQLRAFTVESSCLTHTAGVWGQLNALGNDIRNFYTSGPYSYGVSWASTHLLFVAESRGCQRKGGGESENSPLTHIKLLHPPYSLECCHMTLGSLITSWTMLLKEL